MKSGCLNRGSVLGQIVLFLALIAIAVVLVFSILEPRERKLSVVFLDVGQGDAIYIQVPDGRQILIDGGIGNAVLGRLAQVMPWFDRSIDVVISTHPDRDHIGGLIDVLESYSVSYLYDSGFESVDTIDMAYELASERAGVVRREVSAGDTIEFGEVSLFFMAPREDQEDKESNDGSVVVKLSYGEIDFLLTGDASSSVEERLVLVHGSGLASEVLKLGHHGSKTSSSRVFLETVDPEVAIISADLNNRYGHPHPEVMERVNELGIASLCTCNVGNIVFTSDGESLFYE